jgi:hypothetical protein
MPATVIYNGEDNIAIEFLLKDSNDVVVQLDELTYIILVLYYDRNNVVARYAEPAIPDYEAIIIADPASGIFTVVLKKSSIKDIDPTRPLAWELKLGVPDDTINEVRDMVIKSAPDWVTIGEALTKNTLPA